MKKVETEEEILKFIEDQGPYSLRNRTQKLFMSEISRYHDLVYMKGQVRFFDRFFSLKRDLYKKYKISF